MFTQFDLAWFKCFQNFYKRHLTLLYKKNASETESLRKGIKDACTWALQHARGETENIFLEFSEYELLLAIFFYSMENNSNEFFQHIYELIISCDKKCWENSVKNFKKFITMTEEEFYLVIQRMSNQQSFSLTGFPGVIVRYLKDVCLSLDLLTKSCSEGRAEVVKLVIELGVVVNTPALHAATENGHHVVVDALLDNGAKHYWANDEGYPALYVAAEKGHTNVVKSLLRKAPKISLKYQNGMDLLHIATLNGHIDLVKFLLENNFNVSAITEKKETPLHLACKIKNEKISRILIENEADVNALSSEMKSPLHIAVENEHHEIVKMILDTSKAIVDMKSINGDTPLHMACISNYFQIAETLLSFGGDVKAKNKYGDTPGHVAAANGHVSTCELLFRFGADLEVANCNREQPLHLAVIHQRTEVVEFLLSIMSDIDRQEEHGYTALHVAARLGNERILTLLLKRGADIEEVARDGKRAVHLAEEERHLGAKEILFFHGADMTPFTPHEPSLLDWIGRNSSNIKGNTPFLYFD